MPPSAAHTAHRGPDTADSLRGVLGAGEAEGLDSQDRAGTPGSACAAAQHVCGQPGGERSHSRRKEIIKVGAEINKTKQESLTPKLGVCKDQGN